MTDNIEKTQNQTDRKSLCLLKLLYSCALVLLCWSSSIQAAVLPRTAELVPPETIVLIDIGNFGQVMQQFEETNLYKLYTDPAMEAFVDDFKAKRSEKLEKMDSELVRTIVGADVLPQGRVALALVLDEQTKDANEPPFLFVTQWGENTAKIKEAVDEMVRKAIENGAHRRVEDYRGASITTIVPESSEGLSYCFIDDCLMGSLNLDVLKFVIAHIQGATSPTLSGHADYPTTMRAVGPYHDIDFYVNIGQITKAVLGEAATDKAKLVAANLGLENVVSLAGSIGLGRDPGSSASGKLFLRIDGAKKGIFKVLDIESLALRAPRFIPASAHSVVFINLDVNKAFDELYRVLYGLAPQFAFLMQMPLLPPGPQGEPGVALKPDIIAHLGSQIVVAQSIEKQVAEGAKPRETLVALAVDNRSALEKSLSLLYDKIIAAKNPDARRELLGYTIYLADLSGFAPPTPPGQKTPMQILAATDTPQKPKLAFTVTDTHLIIGTESAVERAIRTLSSTDADSVSSAKWFTTAKSSIPSVVGMASLQDSAASGEFFWQRLKESAKDKTEDSTFSMGLGISTESLFPQLILSQIGLDMLDFSLLPEFDAVRKYFGVSAFYGVSRPDGFFFEFKYLNPPEAE